MRHAILVSVAIEFRISSALCCSLALKRRTGLHRHFGRNYITLYDTYIISDLKRRDFDYPAICVEEFLEFVVSHLAASKNGWPNVTSDE